MSGVTLNAYMSNSILNTSASITNLSADIEIKYDTEGDKDNEAQTISDTPDDTQEDITEK